jgi:probable F420-dependent oxidoreductase
VDLGDVGIWTTYRAIGEQNAGEAAAVVEQLGFGTFWLGGSPRLPSLRPLLETTERIVVATSIVNAKPLSAMRAFLDGLDAAPSPLPTDRRCMAALGPKMLKLSADRSLGAIPYFVPVEHTRIARSEMGADALLAPELAVALDDDPNRAREKARTYAAGYLGLSNYANNLLRSGFTAADIADGGSDRLLDAVVPHGTADEVVPVARAHLAAGADHVVMQAVGEDGIPRRAWAAIAAALSL